MKGRRGAEPRRGRGGSYCQRWRLGAPPGRRAGERDRVGVQISAGRAPPLAGAPSRPSLPRASVLRAHPGSPASGPSCKLWPRPGPLSPPIKLLVLTGSLPRPPARPWVGDCLVLPDSSSPHGGRHAFPGAPQPEGAAPPSGGRGLSCHPGAPG